MIAPLSDIRVIDLAGESAVFAGRLLSQLGAEVIRVEPPAGSTVRERQPFLDGVEDPERSLYHLHYNAGKRGITLDYATERGAALLREVIASCDVLIETARPGRMDELGLGFEALRQINEGLIYGTVTPFGQEGPMAGYEAPDIVASAMSGLMFLNGYPEDPPNQPPSEQAYHMASLALVSALLIAVVGRDRSAAGSVGGTRVDVSIQEAATMATLQNAPPNGYRWHGTIPGRHGMSTRAGTKQIHRCEDGRWISFVVPPYRWREFVAWLDEEGIESEARQMEFRDQTYRAMNGAVTTAAIAELVRRHDSETLFHEGQRRRLLVMPVNGVEHLVTDAQLQERGFFTETTNGASGESLIDAGPPVLFEGQRPTTGQRAPTLGEHNREVYVELLGLSEGDLGALRDQGIV